LLLVVMAEQIIEKYWTTDILTMSGSHNQDLVFFFSSSGSYPSLMRSLNFRYSRFRSKCLTCKKENEKKVIPKFRDPRLSDLLNNFKYRTQTRR
jgi:hypothetical protein